MSTGNIIAILLLVSGGAIIRSLMAPAISLPILFLGLGILLLALALFVRELKKL